MKNDQIGRVLIVKPIGFTDEIDVRCERKRKKRLIQDFGVKQLKERIPFTEILKTIVFDHGVFDCILDMSDCHCI